MAPGLSLEASDARASAASLSLLWSEGECGEGVAIKVDRAKEGTALKFERVPAGGARETVSA